MGLGWDYWFTPEWSLAADARYNWGTSNLKGLDFATFALGARYHFY